MATINSVDGTTYAFPSNSTAINQNTQRASGMPETVNTTGNLAVTSTNIDVYSNGMKVGFIQSLTPSETRTINKIQELGTEGVVQSVPSNTNGGQLAISRFAVYNAGLYNALGMTADGKFVSSANLKAEKGGTIDSTNHTFSNPFKTLKDQRVPLEISVKTKIPATYDATNTEIYVETYIDCWVSSYTKTLAANTITITESATIMYSDVFGQYVVNS